MAGRPTRRGGDNYFLELADFCLTASEYESCLDRINVLHMFQ